MKLSIITINYNNAAGLQRTVDSVLSQTYTDFEYIIVDGASTDGSTEILKHLQQEQSCGNILFPLTIISEPDNGIYNAMNKGIRLAHGEYCLFLNSADSLVEKDTLQQVFSHFPEDVDIVYGKQYDDVNGVLQEELCIDVPYITFDTLRNAHIPHQSTFIRREALLRLGGYDEHYKIISDWAFMMKGIFKCDFTIVRITDYVAVFDMNGISSKTNKTDQWLERINFLHSEFQLFMPDYERWDRLNNTRYMRLMYLLRKWRKRLHIC